ncbi:MAG: Inner membrane protein YgjV [Candidatus Celerinatantimonas neptuna]|nr:MAG: Inner membrane protein YgjV [Candidatus Celerinatantimonas neptuna]
MKYCLFTAIFWRCFGHSMVFNMIAVHFLNHFWAQLFGLVSFFLGMASFCQTNDRRLKLLMVVLNICNTIHYVLLSAVTSMLSSVFPSFRTPLSVKTKCWIVTISFISIILGTGPYFSTKPIDMALVMGMSIGTFALFREWIVLRVASLAGFSCWLINNVAIGSMVELCWR